MKRYREALQSVRDAARIHEHALEPVRRKRLGQFFSGVPLGKLLAHLCVGRETRTVLDPMAGHGDLIDATWEAAQERGIALERLDGIEIDEATAVMCRCRLSVIQGHNNPPKSAVLRANAFEPATISTLPMHKYDVVITNPPYVRYQGRNGNGSSVDPARSGLKEIVNRVSGGSERTIWKALVDGYSGLADLSVPAWLLAGLLVRPGGRLALVVPTTWRSRDYADVIRYLLLRSFAVETIVADTQPGWFSDALVRTQLIVARRLTDEEAQEPVGMKSRWPTVRWLHVAPAAADERSLVGAAFAGARPEAAFADWLHAVPIAGVLGIEVRSFDLGQEWANLRSRIGRRRWYPTLEGEGEDLPLFSIRSAPAPAALPDDLCQMLPVGARIVDLVNLEEAGIGVGQGLRTGCNGFFYVTVCGVGDGRMVPVVASTTLGCREFAVPSSALRPVLRRQSELADIERGVLPPGRVVDLRAWILPEDEHQVARAAAAYELCGKPRPQVMPAELASFVRHAATVRVGGTYSCKRIPELSAVRTNEREARGNKVTPRFWYMLPDFAPRHLPVAFVPRINHATPWIECNTIPPLLIDANFVTFRTPEGTWSPFAMKALLNSVWCRAYMEACGTQFGGGALKIEATHLRKMPIPLFPCSVRAALHDAGKQLRQDTQDVQEEVDRTVLQAVIREVGDRRTVSDLAAYLAAQTGRLRAARQRKQ